MRKWWGNRLIRLGRSLAGLFMASQKDRLLLWAGFISNGQCFAGEAMEGKWWLVEDGRDKIQLAHSFDEWDKRFVAGKPLETPMALGEISSRFQKMNCAKSS